MKTSNGKLLIQFAKWFLLLLVTFKISTAVGTWLAEIIRTSLEAIGFNFPNLLISITVLAFGLALLAVAAKMTKGQINLLLIVLSVLGATLMYIGMSLI